MSSLYRGKQVMDSGLDQVRLCAQRLHVELDGTWLGNTRKMVLTENESKDESNVNLRTTSINLERLAMEPMRGVNDMDAGVANRTKPMSIQMTLSLGMTPTNYHVWLVTSNSSYHCAQNDIDQMKRNVKWLSSTQMDGCFRI